MANNRITTLEESLATTQGNLDILEEEIAQLNLEVVSLRSELEILKGDFVPLEALSIVHAAEDRFLGLLCEGMNDEEAEEYRYNYVSEVIKDVRDGVAPHSVTAAWQRYEDQWNPRKWGALCGYLSTKRGAVWHRDEREVEKYAKMSVDDVRQFLSDPALCLKDLKFKR